MEIKRDYSEVLNILKDVNGVDSYEIKSEDELVIKFQCIGPASKKLINSRFMFNKLELKFTCEIRDSSHLNNHPTLLRLQRKWKLQEI